MPLGPASGDINFILGMERFCRIFNNTFCPLLFGRFVILGLCSNRTGLRLVHVLHALQMQAFSLMAGLSARTASHSRLARWTVMKLSASTVPFTTTTAWLEIFLMKTSFARTEFLLGRKWEKIENCIVSLYKRYKHHLHWSVRCFIFFQNSVPCLWHISHYHRGVMDLFSFPLHVSTWIQTRVFFFPPFSSFISFTQFVLEFYIIRSV